MFGAAPLVLSVSLLVIVSVVIVSIIAWAIKPLKRAMILNPYTVRKGFQVHRLLTAGWIHADAGHLLFNMITLYFFAAPVERTLSPIMFLVLYISGCIASFVPTTLRHMKNPQYNSLGASGAVAAVMFSAILLQPGLKVSLVFVPIGIPGIFYALGYLAYSAYSSYRAQDGVNHGAHLSGALYGSLFTFALQPTRVLYTLKHFF
jgi:membrane associated rhomboid family serine protease